MALDIPYEATLRFSEARDTAEFAGIGKVIQPRITPILALALLAPDIKEALLFLPRELRGKTDITEKLLRPITGELDWGRQRELWQNIVKSIAGHSSCRIHTNEIVRSAGDGQGVLL